MTQQREPHQLTAAEAAESLGIPARTFRSWRVTPAATINGVRYYTARDIIENRLDQERRKAGRSDTPVAELKQEMDALDAELVRLRAARTELRNSELRRELVKLDEITDAIGKAAAGATVVLDALPGRLRRHVPTLKHTDVDLIRSTVVRHQNAIPDWRK